MIISETLAVDHPCLLFLLAAESPKMDSFPVFGRSRFRIFWVDEVYPCGLTDGYNFTYLEKNSKNSIFIND